MLSGRRIRGLLVLLLALAACSSYLTPLGARDFFWHLKTGEWIAAHRELPDGDPFNYATPARLTTMQRFTLTSYWLSQLSYHLVERAFGLPGVVLLNVLLLGALFAAMYAGRAGDDLVFWSLAIVFLCLLRLVPLERPQTFSFVFFAILLAALSRLREAAPGSRAALWWAGAVPLIMLAWSNFHGAHLLGQAVLVLHLAADTLRLGRSRPVGAEGVKLRIQVIAGALGLLCSLANPNGWHAIGYLLPPETPSQIVNVEYQSPLYLYRHLQIRQVAWYGLFLGMCVPALWLSARNPDLPRVALLLLLGFFSLRNSRYLPFFCIAAVPFIGQGLSGRRWTPLLRTLLVALAVVLGSALLWETRGNLRLTRAGGWLSGDFPVGAADFLLANDPQGNLYNSYDWGGYLIWRLGPRRKVFVDSRGLDMASVNLTGPVEGARNDPATGVPVWREVFARYDIGAAVLPVADPDGRMYPLAWALLDDPGWSCVFVDPVALLFVRRTAPNLELLRLHGLTREQVLDALAGSYQARLAAGRGTPLTIVSHGDLLLKRGRFAEARLAYGRAARLQPGDQLIRQRLELAERLLAGAR